MENNGLEKSHTLRSNTTAAKGEDDKTSVVSGTTAQKTQKSGRGSEGEMGGDEHISFLQLVRHPTSIPRLILLSVAGTYWAACRRQLKLMPLHFTDPEMEKYYVNYVTAMYPFRMMVSASILFVAIVIVWVTVTISYQIGYVELVSKKSENLNHLCAGISALLNLVLVWLLKKRAKMVMNHLELWFYVVQFTYSLLITVWGTVCVLLTFNLKPFVHMAEVATYCLAHMETCIFVHPDAAWILLEYSHDLRHYYEIKMLSDSISMCMFFTQIVLADCVFPTRSSQSVWFHLAMIILFAATKNGQYKALYLRQLKAANFLDLGFIFLVYCVGWIARWFRELQERSNIVRVRESQNRLESVKSRVKKRRFDMSPAEEIMEILKGTVEVVKEQNRLRMRKSGPNTLFEVQETLQAAADMLAQSGDTRKSEGEKDKFEGATFDPAKADDEIKEDAFINMYRLDKRATTATVTVSRKARGGGGQGVRWEMDAAAQQITIDEVGFDPPTMIQKLSSDVGENPELRLLEHAENYKPIVIDVGYLLLAPFKGFLEVDDTMILGFLYAIYRNHWATTPYHNSVHAANVAHMSIAMVNALNLMDYCQEEQLIGLILSGLGHVLGHAGKNNVFFIQCDSLVALAQNDNSVMEASSCFMLQSLLNNCEKINILGKLSKDEYMTTRKYIVDLILSLDMSKHFELVSKSRVRRASPEFNYIDDGNDRDMVVQMCFKAADLGHSMMEWPQHLEWSLRLQEEFYQQGVEEAEKGLPISPLCDRKMHNAFAKTQAGYMALIVLPLVDEITSYSPESDVMVQCHQRALFNKQKWEGLRDAKKSPPIPSNCQTEVAPSKYTRWCLMNLMKSKKFADVVQQPTVPMIARC